MATTIFAAIILSMFDSPHQVDYDPSKAAEGVIVLDENFKYGTNNRDVPLRLYLPKSEQKAPLILFSHGLGGSRENNKFLGKHWAGRGYVVVFMQHAGSDEHVWKDLPPLQRMRNMRAAAKPENLQFRVKDVTATLDQLEEWNGKAQKLAGRINFDQVGICGHSFGAITVQATSGQSYGRRGQLYTDKRIKAALPMSPKPPRAGSRTAFAKVKIPWLLMTGTKDEGMIVKSPAADRLKVYQQLPASDHFYQLVLHEAEHLAFSDSDSRIGSKRNPKHHQAILAVSTAFWDAYLKRDRSARKWLNGDAVKKVLEPKDDWQHK